MNNSTAPGPVAPKAKTLKHQDTLSRNLWSSVQLLTPAHRECLKRSFDQMMGKKRGSEIFIRLFQDFPQYKTVFPQFKYLNDGELLTTGSLRMHEDVYMGGLENIIKSLGSDEELALQIRKIAVSHKKKGVTKAHVLNMIPVILHVAKAVNEGALDDQTTESWTVLFNVIAEIVESYKLEK